MGVLISFNICTVRSCHVTYTFQSESTLYNCLNFKELLAQNRREIWRLIDCNWTRTQKHLVRKGTLKWLSFRLRTKWFWVRVQLQSLKLQILHLLRARSSWQSGNYRVWIHSETCTWRDQNIQLDRRLSRRKYKKIIELMKDRNQNHDWKGVAIYQMRLMKLKEEREQSSLW